MDLDVILALIFWPLILFLAYRRVRKKKSPGKPMLRAYLTFLAILGGGALIVFGAMTTLTMIAGLDVRSTGSGFGMIGAAALIPLWRFANKAIQT